ARGRGRRGERWERISSAMFGDTSGRPTPAFVGGGQTGYRGRLSRQNPERRVMPDSPDQSQLDAVARARLISTALPYMLQYDEQVVVVKYGGHAMGDAELAKAFARDITLLHTSGVYPVVVHGGGPQIGRMLDRLAIRSEFRDGLRVTDAKTIEVVEMVLAGSINKEIVMGINAAGGK